MYSYLIVAHTFLEAKHTKKPLQNWGRIPVMRDAFYHRDNSMQCRQIVAWKYLRSIVFYSWCLWSHWNKRKTISNAVKVEKISKKSSKFEIVDPNNMKNYNLNYWLLSFMWLSLWCSAMYSVGTYFVSSLYQRYCELSIVTWCFSGKFQIGLFWKRCVITTSDKSIILLLKKLTFL